MADDDQDRAREMEAEREAETESELERVDQDPDRAQEGSESLGTQSAPSGTPREEGESEEIGGDEGRTRDDREADEEN